VDGEPSRQGGGGGGGRLSPEKAGNDEGAKASSVVSSSGGHRRCSQDPAVGEEREGVRHRSARSKEELCVQKMKLTEEGRRRRRSSQDPVRQRALVLGSFNRCRGRAWEQTLARG
jgi:hypothetical protein